MPNITLNVGPLPGENGNFGPVRFNTNDVKEAVGDGITRDQAIQRAKEERASDSFERNDLDIFSAIQENFGSLDTDGDEIVTQGEIQVASDIQNGGETPPPL